MVGRKPPPQRRTTQQSQESVEFSEPVQPAQPVEFSEPVEATESREPDEQVSEESEVAEQEVTPVPPSSDNPEDPEQTPSSEVVASVEAGRFEEVSLQQLVQEVLAGKWGNGEQRRHLLTQAGHDYDQVQQAVNWRLGGGAPAAYKSSVEEVAAEVIAGHWGEGARLRANLEGAGYIFNQVQAEVDRQKK